MALASRVRTDLRSGSRSAQPPAPARRGSQFTSELRNPTLAGRLAKSGCSRRSSAGYAPPATRRNDRIADLPVVASPLRRADGFVRGLRNSPPLGAPYVGPGEGVSGLKGLQLHLAETSAQNTKKWKEWLSYWSLTQRAGRFGNSFGLPLGESIVGRVRTGLLFRPLPHYPIEVRYPVARDAVFQYDGIRQRVPEKEK